MILVLISVLYSNILSGKTRSISTTRLVSTSGAGAGSILLEEGLFLNPASLSFFKNASFYLQQSKTKAAESDQELQDSLGVIVADTKGSLNGALGFQKINQGRNSTKVFSLASAAAMGENSSMGFNYHYFRESNEIGDTGEFGYRSYYTTNVATTHIIDPVLSMGIIVEDPTNTLREDSDPDNVIVGFQYIFKTYIILMADAGTTYRDRNSGQFLYRLGAQVKFLNDFYLRGGFSRDQTLSVNEKKSGLGVTWVQPKLSFNLAYQDIEQGTELNKEVSLSMSYRF